MQINPLDNIIVDLYKELKKIKKEKKVKNQDKINVLFPDQTVVEAWIKEPPKFINETRVSATIYYDEVSLDGVFEVHFEKSQKGTCDIYSLKYIEIL